MEKDNLRKLSKRKCTHTKQNDRKLIIQSLFFKVIRRKTRHLNVGNLL